MSYIRAALEKDEPGAALGHQQATPPALSGFWKAIIGVVLACNLVLMATLFLDRDDGPEAAQTRVVATPIEMAAPPVAASSRDTVSAPPRPATEPGGARVARPASSAPREGQNRFAQQINAPKKTLPGILNGPVEPAPRPNAPAGSNSSTSAAAASEPRVATSAAGAEPSLVIRPRSTAVSAPASSTQPTLDAISYAEAGPALRTELANLDFSFHIYGSDSSTRAVVVNGSRLREGERFGRFKLLQVLEDGGVVLEMNTGSRATRVRLPNVMEPLPEA